MTDMAQTALQKTAENNSAVRDERPILDVSRISYGDRKKMRHLGIRQQSLDPLEDWEERDRIDDQMLAIMFKAVVSIPDSWLMDDAPPDLDWSDPASINYMQAVKGDQLVIAIHRELQAAPKD